MSASPIAVRMLLATGLLLVPIAGFAQSGGGGGGGGSGGGSGGGGTGGGASSGGGSRGGPSTSAKTAAPNAGPPRAGTAGVKRATGPPHPAGGLHTSKGPGRVGHP